MKINRLKLHNSLFPDAQLLWTKSVDAGIMCTCSRKGHTRIIIESGLYPSHKFPLYIDIQCSTVQYRMSCLVMHGVSKRLATVCIDNCALISSVEQLDSVLAN